MRSLNQIVGALRSGEPVEVEELKAAVVAYDVLLSQLDLPSDPVRLRAFFVAAEADPRVYVGENNWHDSPAAQDWYRAMGRAGVTPTAPILRDSPLRSSLRSEP